MSFALVLKKTSWYRRRYSRPIRVNEEKKNNLNDFSKWLQYNKVKNLRGSEYFPYPLYIEHPIAYMYI